MMWWINFRIYTTYIFECVHACMRAQILRSLFVANEGVNDSFAISILFVYSKCTTRECSQTQILKLKLKHTYYIVKLECGWQYSLCILFVVCQNISFCISIVISKVSKSSIPRGDGDGSSRFSLNLPSAHTSRHFSHISTESCVCLCISVYTFINIKLKYLTSRTPKHIAEILINVFIKMVITSNFNEL